MAITINIEPNLRLPKNAYEAITKNIKPTIVMDTEMYNVETIICASDNDANNEIFDKQTKHIICNLYNDCVDYIELVKPE